MKKIKLLNVIFLLSLLLAICVSIWLYFQLSREIGNISFDEEYNDTPNFKLCPNDKIYQYYSVGTSFKGGREEVRKNIYKTLKTLGGQESTFSGYITTRFIVNCEGEIDRFRIMCVTNNFQDYSINATNSNSIIKAIRNLKDFLPGTTPNGKIVNSYFQLNFKIEEGEIVDIF